MSRAPSTIADRRVGLLLAFAGLMAVACPTRPARVLDLMEAETDSQREDAVDQATDILAGRRTNVVARMAAAKVLGRLRVPTEAAIDGLGAVLRSSQEPPALRAFCAWALGEMRHERSLSTLLDLLRSRLDPLAGHAVLEALAKHHALLSRSPKMLLLVAEGLVFFAGNQTDTPPPIYDVLSDSTRTLPVSIQVLDRALDARARSDDPRRRAALYNAVFELLARLERDREAIASAPDVWAVRVAEAVRASQRAVLTADEQTRLLAIWYLGRLAREAALAKPAAEALVGTRGDLSGRPTRSPQAELRLVATWALARMQLHAPGPRRALLIDLLPVEVQPAILRLLGDLDARPKAYDQLQKILGLTAREVERR